MAYQANKGSYPVNSSPLSLTQADSAIDEPERLYAKYEAAKKRTPILHYPSIVTHADASTNNNRSHATVQSSQIEAQEILRVVPANIEARKAFDTVVRLSKKGVLHQHHASYIRVTGQGPVGYKSKKATRHSEETTDEAASDHDTAVVYEGFFRLCFSRPTVHQGPIWVWLCFLLSLSHVHPFLYIITFLQASV